MQSRRVFLVDDNLDFLCATRRYLADEPEVEIVGDAHSGQDALDQIAGLQPDLVLMDLSMPDMNGLETTRRLKASAAPFVVIVTSHQGLEFQQAAEAAGADGFVSKADLSEKLLPMVRKLKPGPDKEERFQSLVENALDAIAVLDPQGIILYESPSVETMLGFKSGELVGQCAFRMIHADDLPLVQATFARAIESPGVPQRVEFRHVHRDGSWRFLESVGQCLLESGEMSVIVNSRDVTERKLTEHSQFHKQKMETFGQLAGGVAHDFNNLLSVITGYGEMVMETLSPDHPAREFIAEIQKASWRACGLTRQLLAFSRKQVLAPVILDLNVIVADMVKMLQRLIGEDCEVISLLQPCLPRIKADAGQIEQVIMNLVVNARDAMPDGGRLTISTSRVMLGETNLSAIPEIPPGNYVVLAVGDTGCGIEPATRARIFEPYFTTKEPGRGTGLGLATVFGIVVQSDGHIHVTSAPGEGSLFQIFLPQVEDPIQLEQGADLPASPPGRETVLLAEDDAAVRNVVTQFLRINGFTVLEALDGDDALRQATEFPGEIHLLVTDLVMPRLNGAALYRQLVCKRPGMKVLYVSGYTEDVAVRQGLLSGDITLLHKPFGPNALVMKVREALNRQENK